MDDLFVFTRMMDQMVQGGGKTSLLQILLPVFQEMYRLYKSERLRPGSPRHSVAFFFRKILQSAAGLGTQEDDYTKADKLKEVAIQLTAWCIILLYHVSVALSRKKGEGRFTEHGKQYIHLFHGRKDPDEVLEDWGSDGPTFGPVAYVQGTYATDLKAEIKPSELDKVQYMRLLYVEDMVYYDGVYYGDYSVYISENRGLHENPVDEYDEAKARPPKVEKEAEENTDAG